MRNVAHACNIVPISVDVFCGGVVKSLERELIGLELKGVAK